MLNALLQQFSVYKQRSHGAQASRAIVLPPADANDELHGNLLGVFAEAYNTALVDDFDSLLPVLRSAGKRHWTAVYEGAFAGLATLDIGEADSDWPRLNKVIAEFPQQMPLVNSGFGAALAHLNMDPIVHIAAIDEFWAYMGLDSYGFHEGYFNWNETFSEPSAHPHLPPLARAAIDEGFGRAAVTITGGSPTKVFNLVQRFPEDRKADVWVGVGMHTGFWGYPDIQALRQLYKLSDNFQPYLQQGIAIAAWVRHEHNSWDDYTEVACRELCKMSTQELGKEVDVLKPTAFATQPTTADCKRWRDSILTIFTHNFAESNPSTY
jgi:hypothetical protein